MSSVLSRFLTAWRMELRLLTRHWTYPVLNLVWIGVVLFMQRNFSDVSATVALSRDLGAFSIGIMALPALIVGAATAARGERTRFVALDESYPTGAEVTLGRWLATVVALLPSQIVPLILAYRIGPPIAVARAVPVYVLEATITFAFATALGWCLVTWLGARRWIYPLLGMGWVGALGLPVLFGVGNLNIPGSRLADFMRSTAGNYDSFWGRITEEPLPTWFNLFYTGLAVLALALIALHSQRRRLRRLPIVPGAVALAAFALTATAATAYVTQIQDWRAQAEVPVWVEYPTPDEAVDAWDIDVDLTQPATPKFVTRMAVRNASEAPLEQVTLSLYRDLEVTESSLPFERDGDALIITPPQPLAPGETIELRLAYEGSLWVFVSMHREHFEPVAFTKDTAVRLVPGIGWYPLPGRANLGYSGVVDHPPAQIHLSVTAPPDLPVVTNLPSVGEHRYAAERATWANLYAHPHLRTEQLGRVTVISPDEYLPWARKLAPRYEAAMEDMARFFPEVEPSGLTLAVLDWGGGFHGHTPPADQQLFVQLDPNRLPGIEQYPGNAAVFIGDEVARDLTMISTGKPPAWHIEPFLWAMHISGGDPDKLRAELEARIDSEEPHIVTLALVELYEADGESAVARALQRLAAADEDVHALEGDALLAWILEAGRAD